MISDVDTIARQQWMSVLARAGKRLEEYDAELRQAEYCVIRAPEIGMALVRGRIGASGSPFNLGEMTITRCAVRFADGRTGHSYIAGRDKRQAELAALADAHLQGPEQPHWLARLIDPLARAHAEQRAARAADSAATKVEFLTLVRGEG